MCVRVYIYYRRQSLLKQQKQQFTPGLQTSMVKIMHKFSVLSNVDKTERVGK